MIKYLIIGTLSAYIPGRIFCRASAIKSADVITFVTTSRSGRTGGMDSPTEGGSGVRVIAMMLCYELQ